MSEGVKGYRSTKIRMEVLEELWRISGEFMVRQRRPVPISTVITVLVKLYDRHKEEAWQLFQEETSEE